MRDLSNVKHCPDQGTCVAVAQLKFDPTNCGDCGIQCQNDTTKPCGSTWYFWCVVAGASVFALRAAA